MTQLATLSPTPSRDSERLEGGVVGVFTQGHQVDGAAVDGPSGGGDVAGAIPESQVPELVYAGSRQLGWGWEGVPFDRLRTNGSLNGAAEGLADVLDVLGDARDVGGLGQ